MLNYYNDPIWKEMQSFLPERNRITKEVTPEEYHISVLSMKIHIDHYKYCLQFLSSAE